jgi:hypothetical protein
MACWAIRRLPALLLAPSWSNCRRRSLHPALHTRQLATRETVPTQGPEKASLNFGGQRRPDCLRLEAGRLLGVDQTSKVYDNIKVKSWPGGRGTGVPRAGSQDHCGRGAVFYLNNASTQHFFYNNTVPASYKHLCHVTVNRNPCN